MQYDLQKPAPKKTITNLLKIPPLPKIDKLLNFDFRNSRVSIFAI